MTAALTLMAKDRKGLKISFQVLLIPATDACVDSQSYKDVDTGRFLSRDFMKYGWDRYVPDEKSRDNPTFPRSGHLTKSSKIFRRRLS